MSIEMTPMGLFLLERWKSNVFSAEIYPGFPFRNANWLCFAFNRDRQGDVRVPAGIWNIFFGSVRKITDESWGFLTSTEVLLGGVVMKKPQPFVVGLSEDSILAHFRDSSRYLPSFYMVGASEAWGVWGDSDFTVVGGESVIMREVLAEMGGEEEVVRIMSQDFGVNDIDDSEMVLYLKNLVRFL